jgi:3-hydroxyacyl-CoA dehydrogenase
LIHVFFAERNTRKVAGLPAPGSYPKIASGGVIGAGTMGGGIAICFANAGLPVTVLDSSQEALDRGFGGHRQDLRFDGQARPIDGGGQGQTAGADSRHAELFGPRGGGRGDRSRVRKPGFETEDLQGTRCGRQAGRVLATNTSTLDIDAIAAATRRPADVVGLHFFSPANVMPLLEVVRTDITAPAVIGAALDLAKALRKRRCWRASAMASSAIA